MTNNVEDKDVVYFARLHWIIFLGPILGLIIALSFAFNFAPLHEVAYLFAACFFFWIIMTWFTYYFSSLTIKKRQIILRTGVLVRQTIDIPLGKIESIDIRQSVLGSIFRYGILIITGTGGTRQSVNYLQRPLTCRRYIEQLMNEQ